MLGDRRPEPLTRVISRDPDLQATPAKTWLISSLLIAPSRRICTCSPVQSTMVDATPPGRRPPSLTTARRSGNGPSRSFGTPIAGTAEECLFPFAGRLAVGASRRLSPVCVSPPHLQRPLRHAQI